MKHPDMHIRGNSLIILLLLLCTSVPSWAQTASPFHIAILGDSNTWLGGDECDQPKGWNYWFCKRTEPTSCHSYARSGATWTNTSSTKRNVKEYTEKLGNDNVIYNQVCRLQEAVDSGLQPLPQLIIIAAGTNDAWFTDKRPHVFAMTGDEPSHLSDSIIIRQQPDEVLTLAESVIYNCKILQEAFPDAQLILLSPMQSTAVPTANINQAGDIIENCGNQLHIGVIRMDKNSCVNREQEQHHRRYTYDGTHTSEEGARTNGYYIAKQVNAMLFPPTE